jgi:hypothetical protein
MSKRNQIQSDIITICSDKKIKKTSASVKKISPILNCVNNNKIVLTRSIKSPYGFSKWSDATKFVKKYSDIYEVYGSDKVKPYIDYEVNIKFELDDNKLEKMKFQLDMDCQEERVIKKLREITLHIMIHKFGLSISENDILIATSSGFVDNNKYKISLHLIVNSKYYFMNSTKAKVFCLLIDSVNKLLDGDDIITMHQHMMNNKAIDPSVYKIVQQMRCIFQAKLDGRILKPIDLNNKEIDKKNINYYDYFISHIKKNAELIDTSKYEKVDEKVIKKVLTRTYDETALSNDTRKIIKCVTGLEPSANYENSANGCLNFNYDHTKKCPVTGKKHDQIGFYSFTRSNNICIGCHSERCRDKIKTIGQLSDPSYWSNDKLDNNLNVNLKYLTQISGKKKSVDHLKVMKYIDQFVKDVSIKALAVKSVYATGKTYMLDHIIKKNNFKRILWISHRQLFSQDIRSRFKDFAIHNELSNEEISLANKLIISPESLYKLFVNGKFTKYDLIIIDESESVIEQFHSPTHTKDHLANFQDFYDYILTMSKKIITLDADLDCTTIDLIKDFNFISIHNKYKSSLARQYHILKDNDKSFAEHEKAFINMILQDLKKGKNISVVTLGASFGLSLKKTIIDYLPELENKIMYHYSGGDDSDKDILKDVNGKLGWSAYRLLIYSPQIGAGIDFNVLNHFDKVYGYIANTAPASEFMQMCNRVRSIKNDKIICLTNKSMYKGVDGELYNLDDMEHFYKYIDKTVIGKRRRLVEDNGDTVDTIIVKDDPVHLYEKVYQRLYCRHLMKKYNNRGNNYLTTMNHMLTAKGDELHFIGFGNDKIEIKKDCLVDNLKNAKILSESVYKEVIKKDKKTAVEKIQVNKFQLKSHLGVTKLTDDLIDDYMGNEKKVDQIMKYIDKNYENGGTVFDEKIIEKKNQIFSQILEVIGVDYLVEKDDLDAETFDNDKFEFIDKDVLKLFGIRSISGKTYHIVKAICAKYGLILSVNNEKKWKDGKKENIILSYNIKNNTNIMNILLILVTKVKSGITKQTKSNLAQYDKYNKLIKMIDLDIRKVKHNK